MSKQEKIEFILKRLGDHLTKAYLETKPESCFYKIFLIESQNDDRQMDSMVCEMF